MSRQAGNDLGGWHILFAQRVPHCVPINDLRPHDAAPDCWCKPTDDDGVMVHHSLDGREHREHDRPHS